MSSIILLNLISCLLIYILASKFISKKTAVIPTVIALLSMFCISTVSLSISIAINLIFLAALAIFKYYDTMQIKQVIPLGIFVGILCIFRIDMGSFIYGMYFWAMFWAGLAGVKGRELTLLQRTKRGVLQGIFFTLLVVLTIVIFIVYEKIFLNDSVLLTKLYIEVQLFFSGKGIFQIPKFDVSPMFIVPFLLYIAALAILIAKHKLKILLANDAIFWKEMLIVNIGLNLYPQAVVSLEIENLVPLVLIAGMLLPNIIKFPFQVAKTQKNN